jgi:hypothetical protein
MAAGEFLMDNATEANVAAETKTKRAPSSRSEATGKQYAASKLALKLRKKKAHRRKLNSSNANG